LPFCLAAIIVFFAIREGSRFQPLPTPAPVNENFDFGEFCLGVLRGISQIFLLESWVQGLIIVVGIFFCSPYLFFGALFGSTAGTVFGLVLGSPLTDVYDGLWGYDAALAGIAVLAFRGKPFIFFPVMTLLILTCALSSFLRAMLEQVGFPQLTLGFNFAIYLSLSTHLRGLSDYEYSDSHEHGD
jgi:urea transporter